MNYIACTVAVAPLRKEADHRSEMVSQLLLGEFAEILDFTKDFIRVKCQYDGYEGWCQRRQLVQVDKMLIPEKFTGSEIDSIRVNDDYCRVSIGTPVYDGLVKLGLVTIDYSSIGGVPPTELKFTQGSIISFTGQYMNVPYLWGGKSIFGIDCSGFTQQVFKFYGIKLPRDASQQAMEGESVGFLEEAKSGDLAFFDNEEGHITHVGILLDSEKIIHSSGNVRIDKIDNAGIVNSSTGERTHNLRLVKRYRELQSSYLKVIGKLN
jgi:hypothetical protein